MRRPVRSEEGRRRRREADRLRKRELFARETPEEREERLTAQRARWRRRRATGVVSNAARRGATLDREHVEILLRDPCAYCGAPSTGVDHIVPMKAHGADGWDNLTASCRDCNRRKRAMPLLDFLLRDRLALDVPDAVAAAVLEAIAGGHAAEDIRRRIDMVVACA